MNIYFNKKLQFGSVERYWREVIALLMILLAVFFFHSERKEFHQIIPQIKKANPIWVLAGVAVTILYIAAQSLMYCMAFRLLGIRYSFVHAGELFLKRNFLSVFLPAGGVSSLAYMPSHIRRQGILPGQLYQASSIYAFSGLLTTIMVGLPVILSALIHGNNNTNVWIGLGTSIVFILLIFFLFYQLNNKRGIYRFIDRRFHSLAVQIDELFKALGSKNRFWTVVLFSLLVECCGIIHMIIAMKALNIPFHLEAAAMAYVISVSLMIVSPFLRGLGAVEFSVAAILGLYGVAKVEGLSVTILYRIFEFWLPFASGFFVFAWKGRNLFARIFPVLLIFSLGIINIVSVVTPPLAQRVHLLNQYIPFELVRASNLLVFLLGLMLLVNAAFLFKGLRTAWWVAFVLSLLSLVGHVSKALDWEEAAFALVALVMLTGTNKQYRLKSSNRLARAGIKIAFLIFLAVSVFGYIAFYFIDVKHFGVDFTWKQSLVHSLNIFLLVNDDGLHAKTRFGYEFIWLIRVLGVFALTFLFYTIIRPFVLKKQVEDGKERARIFIEQYGNSSTDYFKLMDDKLFFFPDKVEGFIAYRVANGFAVALDEPVCEETDKIEAIRNFEQFCKQMGLAPVYYRVDERRVAGFNSLKKRKLLLGQEAIIDLNEFTLEGKDKKSLRNGINSLQKKGYTALVCIPPFTAAFMAELKSISDEWLKEFDKKEMVFSQGMFDYDKLQNEDIIVVRDEHQKAVAFLNVIPDYSPGECTYDLIRRTADAPGGCMDVLVIALIDYAKQRRFDFLNLGLAPLSGIEGPASIAEHAIRYAYEKVKRFNHYKGLRFFKEKFATFWENKYLIYEHDYDLLNLPVALNKIMKP